MTSPLLRKLIRSLPALLMLAMSNFISMSQAETILHCNMNHPGATERSKVSVDDSGRVSGFTWTLDKKNNGFCSIQATSFRIVTAERFLDAQGCELMTWWQGTRLTLALSPATPSCRAYCSSQQAYESMLPLVFDGVGCSS